MCHRFSYTTGMKTAISLPDELFLTADAFAARAQLSRSELYSLALREYLSRHDQDQITAQLDTVCAELDSGVPIEITRATRSVWGRDPW